MNVSLYEAAAAMQATSRWQEVIAENLSAGTIPGFKKQQISFDAVQAGYLQSAAGAGRAGFPSARSTPNFGQGEMKPTGGTTDFALEGPGFFEVRLPDGNTAYTRDGEFRLNGQGQLVTKEGYVVQGTGGPLQFDPANPGALSMGPHGDLSQGSELMGQLRVADFADPQRLTPLGSGYYVARQAGVAPLPAEGTTLRQGYLEAANFSTVTEMVNLITAMRMHEANQRVLQSQDERMARAINELGQPT